MSAVATPAVGETAAASYLDYPPLRFMGSKHRLLPWIEGVLADLEFDSALDAFSGSGCVSYLLKTMGKEVRSNDFLRFATDLTTATVVNSAETLTAKDVELLLTRTKRKRRFVERTFKGIFFADEDNRFLDQVWVHPTFARRRRINGLYTLATLDQFVGDLREAARIHGLN